MQLPDPVMDGHLFVQLDNECWMHMSAAFNRKQYVIDSIEKDRDKEGIYPFRDISGGVHAAFKMQHLQDYRFMSEEERGQKPTTPEDVAALDSDKHRLKIALHYPDGFQYIEHSIANWREFCLELLWLMNDETDHLHTNLDGSKTRIEGRQLIGFCANYGMHCQCPIPAMLNQGCPSARGQRCPNLGSLERVRVPS